MAEASVEIARIDAVIADAERCIERQRQLITDLSAAGDPIDEAELTLGLLLGTLEHLRHLKLNIHSLLPDGLTRQ
jgi:hypothetical protein